MRKMSEGKFIPSWILFPRKNQKNITKISAVGVEVEGGAHLCFTSASCYVAPYLGLQGMLLPSHKKFAWRFCCSLNMFLHSVPEQRWKSMLTLWPGFAKQYSIHPVPNAQYITRPFFFYFRKLFTYSTIIKLRTVSVRLISSSVLGLKRQ